jgi:molecular chaperone GrpE
MKKKKNDTRDEQTETGVPEKEKNEHTENTSENNNNKELNSDQSAEAECKEDIKNWKQDYDELYDKYLRIYSEFENFRRRTQKEKFDTISYANSSLIQDLLPVLDDFERALKSMEESENIPGIKNGIALIFNKFRNILENKGVSEIDCIGKEFDPEIHEAISKIEAPSKKMKGKIIDQVQKGYFLKEKVIRHSKVVVGE